MDLEAHPVFMYKCATDRILIRKIIIKKLCIKTEVKMGLFDCDKSSICFCCCDCLSVLWTNYLFVNLYDPAVGIFQMFHSNYHRDQWRTHK